MKIQQTKRLTRAVHRWLSFQNLCGRSMLFSEGYLSQPIAEYVAFHHSGKISPEHNHPQFSALSGGRPKQVDFALLTPSTSDVEVVIEAKWIRHSKYPKQAILDDLLRLECFRDPNRHVRRYFLVGGLVDHFNSNFRDLNYRNSKSNTTFTKLFFKGSFKSPKQNIDVYSSRGTLRTFYRTYHKNYGVDVPKRFTTTLISRSRLDGIAVYLWQIESVPRRSVFKPKNPAW